MKSYTESRPLHGFIHDIIINILTMPNILAIIVIIETDNTYKKTSKGEITHEKESTIVSRILCKFLFPVN